MVDAEEGVSRRKAFYAMVPFLLLGIADVVLLLLWGVEPLWGFMILPPILFVSALTWIAHRGGLARNRTGDPTADATPAPDGDPESVADDRT